MHTYILALLLSVFGELSYERCCEPVLRYDPLIWCMTGPYMDGSPWSRIVELPSCEVGFDEVDDPLSFQLCSLWPYIPSDERLAVMDCREWGSGCARCGDVLDGGAALRLPGRVRL